MFKDKKFILTGANGFLGQNISKTLKENGAIVYGYDVIGEKQLNIANVSEVEKEFSILDNIDGIINNAAISYKGKNTTEEQFDKTMDVNIKGTYNVINSAVKCKLLKKNSSIINVASVYGMISPNFKIYEGNEEQYNSVIYGSSKAAVIQMTKYFAVQLANSRIRVNAISPSGINGGQDIEFIKKYSENVPEKRMVEPEEVVEVIMFLLSSKSSGINGANIPITAGMEIW